MRTFFFMGIITILLIACQNKQEPQAIDRVQIEKELLSAIEDRFYAWRDNDFEAHLNTYHSDWRRWDRKVDLLLKKEDLADLWDKAKLSEEPMDMSIELEDFDILENGKVAIVHFLTKESFKWIGADVPPYIYADSLYEGVNRWSDVMLKENGEWLCIGGHRDRSQSPKTLTKLE